MHLFLKPSYFHYFSRIKFRHIRFNIQKRSSIYNVYILNMEYTPFNLNKAYYGEADWVRSTRTSHGKDSTHFVIHIWLCLQGHSPG